MFKTLILLIFAVCGALIANTLNIVALVLKKGK